MPQMSTMMGKNDKDNQTAENFAHGKAERLRGGVSTGNHATKRQQDATRAAAYKIIHDHYQTCSRFWKA